MTAAELRELIVRCDGWSAHPGVTEIPLPTRDLAALARLALAARDAQDVEHAERCSLTVGSGGICTCGLRELDAALAAVFGGDEQ